MQSIGRPLVRYHIAFPFKYTSLPLWVPPPPPRGRGCSCPSHFVYPPPPLGVGFVCVPPAWVTEGGRGGSIEAAVTFFAARLRPFARASSSLEPIFPVFGASLSHCPPCAALSAEFFLGRPLGRGPRPGPGPNVRPWLMRTAILLGIHLNPSEPSSQAWSGPVSTEVGDHLGTLGAVRFFICPSPPPPSRFRLPSLPTCTHGTCATAYVQGSWRPPSTPTCRPRRLELILVYG